ncbi:MAG: ATP-binding protein [Actinobacteria bacterium]|nr:ATP-binding protein [Actinomycetota bacterium]
MIEPMSAQVANAERFARLGVTADAEHAGRTRTEFSQWLDDFFALDAVRTNDVVLATNEALANAAEFAYWSAAHPGTIDVQARHHAADGRLTVTVSDRGTWRAPDPHPVTRLRGRGIPLMRALTDSATIETTPQGTHVRLEWTGVPRR